VKVRSQTKVSATSTGSPFSAGTRSLLRYLDNRRDLSKFEGLFRAGGRKQMHRTGDDSRPAGLVTCAEASPIVAMKIFIKQNFIAPVLIFLKLASGAIDWPFAILVFQKDASETTCDFLGDLVQS